MKIYITGLPSGYEVEHLVRLFYPMAPLTLTAPEDGEDCVWAEKKPDGLWAMVRERGKSKTAQALLPDIETPEFALASLTYDLLRAWTGIRPPWGKMTGVRPVGLIHDKRAAGAHFKGGQRAQDLQPLYRDPVLPLPVQLLQLCQLQPGPGPQDGAALCGLPLPGGGGDQSTG